MCQLHHGVLESFVDGLWLHCLYEGGQTTQDMKRAWCLITLGKVNTHGPFVWWGRGAGQRREGGQNVQRLMMASGCSACRREERGGRINDTRY